MDKLRMGVAQEIITPKVGGHLAGYGNSIFSTCVNDDLTVTAYYFEQGGQKALMISACVCSIRVWLSRHIREMIANEHNIPVDHITISCIHTHSGPATFGGYFEEWEGDIDREYCESIFIPQILKAAARAIDAAVPVKMGVGIGQSQVGVNRQELRLDNAEYLGQKPWGPYDPRMTVLAFRDEAGKPIANIVHYGCHNTAAGQNTEITRDWSGLMVDALAEKSGAITAFFNGPEGDVGPRLSNGKTVGDLSYVRELGAVAARDVLAVYDSITEYQEVDLKVHAKEIAIPLRARLTKEEAQQLYDENINNKTGGQHGNHNRVKRALAVLEAIEQGVPEKSEDVIKQRVLALGDQVFVDFPFELFSQIGMRIDGAFPDKHVLSLALTDGGRGYFSTEESLVYRSYETMMYRFSGGKDQEYIPHADHALILETIRNIEEL